MTFELRIKTPEGITFAYTLAGPLARFIAWLVDLAVMGVATAIATSILQIGNLVSLDLSRALIVVAYFTLPIAYGIGTEWFWRGQTLGKRLLKLRVLDEHGLKLQMSQIVIRNLLRFADMLPGFYLVGGLACLLSKRAQRLGDFAANTVVVRHPALAEPDLDQLALGKFNSLRDHPRLEARLRQLTGVAEARLALQALVRRDDFQPAARIELFAELAAHFKKRVVFPPETIEAISDEQYVRNVVDVLFRARKPAPAGAEKNVAMPV